MKKSLVAVLCTASMSLTACGGGYCDDFVASREDLSEKACASVTLPLETKEQCETRYEALNDAQKEEAQESLEAQRNCIEDLDECTEETLQAWNAGKDVCLLGGTAGDQE